MESQITLLVWPLLSLTEKQRTINHIIIFNDSVSFTSAAFEAFAEAYYDFLYLPHQKKKKIAGAIKFLGILKGIYFSPRKIYIFV